MTTQANSVLPSPESTDSELVEIISREPKSEMAQRALETLFERYAKILYTFARTRGLNEDVSQELAQETLTQVFRVLQEKVEPQQVLFRHWILAIAQRMMRQSFRKGERRTGEVEKELESIIDEHGLDFAQKSEATDLVNNLLNNLDEKSREILSLLYIEELTIDEIAKKLRLSRNAVYVRLHHARKKLAQVSAIDAETRG
jgi:RNA polymerase sigma factor (sigma-70 family)